MPYVNKVIWVEGMLLRQQQFQQQERYLENLIQQHCLAISHNHWGITELEFDPASLPLNRIGIKSCSGIFPDGTLFNTAQDAVLAGLLEVPAGVTDCLVYLAIPNLRLGLAKIGTNNKVYRYQSRSLNLQDEHSANPSDAEVEVAELQLQLLLATDDLSQYVSLPIARIKEATAEKGIIFDENFIPPCLSCQAIPALQAIVNELSTLLYHRMTTLGQRLSKPRTDSVNDLSEFLLLQVVNRQAPLFEYLTKKVDLHPEQFYCYAIQLLGELATFTEASKITELPPIYSHKQIQQSLQPILIKLRAALHTVFEQSALRLPLATNELGIHMAVINETRLFDTADFILAVKAQIAAEQIQQHLPKQIKIASLEQIQDLITSQVPGLKVERLSVAPPQIPYYAGASYFAIQPDQVLWQKMKMSGGLAIYITGEFPGLELSCWAIRRN